MQASTKLELRETVRSYMDYAPNSHLGDCTPREDLHSAFNILRYEMKAGSSIQSAIVRLDRIAYSMSDM